MKGITKKIGKELLGGLIATKEEAKSRLLERIVQQSTLDREDLALIVEWVCKDPEGKLALVWSGDHTVSGDWKVQWLEPWIDRTKLMAIACFGDLTIEGDLLNPSSYRCPLLFVTGNLRVRNLIKGGMQLIVLGDLLATGYVVDLLEDSSAPFLSQGKGGLLRVGGDLVAAGYVPACGDFTDVKGHVIAGSLRAPMFDARVHGRPEMRAAFVPEVLADGWYDDALILVREHEGLPVWRDPSAPLPPLPKAVPPSSLPVVAGVDPVSLGKLVRANESGPRLREMIAAAVPQDPDSSSYPETYMMFVRLLEESHPRNPFLLLPPGTHLHGDLELDWDKAWLERHGIAGVACEGDLTIEGDVLNRNSDSGPLLFVGGTLRVRNLIKGGSPVIVLGDVEASGLVIGDYNHGVMRIRGDLRAQAFLLIDHSGYVHGKIQATEYDWNRDDARQIFVPDVFEDEYEDLPSPEIDWLWARQRAGLPILRTEL